MTETTDISDKLRRIAQVLFDNGDAAAWRVLEAAANKIDAVASISDDRDAPFVDDPSYCQGYQNGWRGAIDEVHTVLGIE